MNGLCPDRERDGFRARKAGHALLTLGTPPLAAETVGSTTKAAARDLGTEGVEAHLAGDCRTALTKISRAYAALPVPSLGLWSARAFYAGAGAKDLWDTSPTAWT